MTNNSDSHDSPLHTICNKIFSNWYDEQGIRYPKALSLSDPACLSSIFRCVASGGGEHQHLGIWVQYLELFIIM